MLSYNNYIYYSIAIIKFIISVSMSCDIECMSAFNVKCHVSKCYSDITDKVRIMGKSDNNLYDLNNIYGKNLIAVQAKLNWSTAC